MFELTDNQSQDFLHLLHVLDDHRQSVIHQLATMLQHAFPPDEQAISPPYQHEAQRLFVALRRALHERSPAPFHQMLYDDQDAAVGHVAARPLLLTQALTIALQSALPPANILTLLSHIMPLLLQSLLPAPPPPAPPASTPHQFRTIVAQSIDGIVLTGEDGRIVEWNHGAELLSGIARADAIGKPSVDILFRLIPSERRTPELHSHYQHVMTVCLATGEAPWHNQTATYPVQHVDGSVRMVEQVGFTIATPRGFMICSIIRDITARKQAEDDLRARQERYERAIKATRVGIWDWNLQTNEFYIDPNLKALLGYEDHEIANALDDWMCYVHPDDRSLVEEQTSAYLAGTRSTYEYEHRMIHKDGSVRWLLVHGKLERTPDGRPLMLSGTDTDITERKQVDEKLRTSEARYRAIVEDQTELICRFRPDGTLTFVNNAYCRYFGKTREELMGHGTPAIIPAAPSHSQSQLAGFSPENPVASMEHRVINADGEVRWHQWTDRTIFDSAGNIIEFQSVGRDITERKRMEETLRVQRDLAFALSSTSDMLEALRRVLDIIIQIEGIDSGGVYLADRQSGALNLIIHTGLSDSFVQQTRHFAADAPLTCFVMQGQPFYGHYDELMPDDFAVSAEGLHALVVLPVLEEGQVVASLTLASHIHDLIPRSARHVLEIIAAQIGSVIARVRTEAALRESQHNLQTLFDTLDDFLFVLNMDGNILHVNPVVERRLAYSTHELQHMHILDVHQPQRYASTNSVAPTLNYDTGIYVGPLITRDGNHIPVETRISRGIWNNRDVLFGISRDITELKRAERSLLEVNEQLKGWVNELEQRNREITLLNEMGDYLQSCLNTADAYRVVAQYADRIFEGLQGALYILDATHNMAEAVATWGNLPSSETVFATEGCWALRRGRAHEITSTHHGPQCRTVGQDTPIPPHLCVPMIAQGSLLGVLHLRTPRGETAELHRRRTQLATMVAEHIALALSNLQLRERLRQQSISDPLTGLFNRRYLEETLVRELRKANRQDYPVGIIMVDIDHFKRFNDTYGHDAGDTMLSAVGYFLQTNIRDMDIACRYGGEEFTLILPGATLDDTRKRAEQLCAGVQLLDVEHGGIHLGAVSLSLGVACFPFHGTTVQEVVRAADNALLRAKDEGRGCVVLAGTCAGQP